MAHALSLTMSGANGGEPRQNLSAYFSAGYSYKTRCGQLTGSSIMVAMRTQYVSYATPNLKHRSICWCNAPIPTRFGWR
jgi:hypothetical protein